MEDLILELIAAVVMLVIGWLSMKAKQWFNIEIEARHRDALHSAAMSGVDAALKGGAKAGANAIIQGAKDHIRSSVPQALDALKPTDLVLTNIIGRYVRDRSGVK